MTTDKLQLMWTCIWNHFTPFWSISRASSEEGPESRSALSAYVNRPDVRQFDELVKVMDRNREEERAVVVGQRGAGKSMDLAWLAYKLSRTHLVLWIDALEQSKHLLYDPVQLYIAIGSAAYEGAQKCDTCNPDRRLFEAFLSTCLDTVTHEEISKEQLKVRVDEALQSLSKTVSQVLLPVGLATANPIFIAAGGVATFADLFFDGVEAGAEAQETRKRSRTSEPDARTAAARLRDFVKDIEDRCNRPIAVVVDGLDRVEEEQVKDLFQRGLDLARPKLRLILTAPLVLYATPEFDQLQGFFPHVITSPNLSISDLEGANWQFMRQIVERRLEFCGKVVEDVFEEAALTSLIEASGGNIRQLIMLVREACLQSDLDGKVKIDTQSAEAAINDARADFGNRMKAEHLQAMRNFLSRDDPGIPPGGDFRDELLRSKYIFMYQENKHFKYRLNPLIRAYLREEGLL